MAGEIGENPVTAFLMQPIQLVFEETLEIHHHLQCPVAFLPSKRSVVNPGQAPTRGLRQKASRPQTSVILRGACRAWQAGKAMENDDTFSNLSAVIRRGITPSPIAQF
ncbi:hypothetical protein Q1M63_34010 [Sinorhizobium meliloti]|nr:hypothetical protein Q1M63_34010 [Sinorhizobium meliloti]